MLRDALATAWRNVANVCVDIFKVADAVHQCVTDVDATNVPDACNGTDVAYVVTRPRCPDARRRRC
jgi:hypothetical protein